ncbi:MAG: endonuclease III [Parvibaculales bacterium]
MKVAQIPEFFARLKAANPIPEPELDFVNIFTLLVAVVLSAQATDKGVNKATKGLFKVADTPEKMAALGEAKIREHVRTIGLYRSKAKNVYLLSRQLIDDHDSQVPDTMEALIKLPGVGRKTANVVLNIGYGKDTFAVDTHVFRISNRTGLAPGKTVLDVEKKLDRRVPEPFRVDAHHWLILHGRYICKARKPDCPNCVVHDLCRFKGKTVAA